MDETRDIFRRVLEAPAPVMADSTTMLNRARRTLRRRRIWTSATVTAAIAVVMSVIVTGSPGHRATPALGLPVSGQPTTSPTTTTPSTPFSTPPPPNHGPGTPVVSGPPYQHAQSMLALLAQNLPVGYDTTEPPSHNPTVHAGADVLKFDNGDWQYGAYTEVNHNGRQGSLGVVVYTGTHALQPASDLCAQMLWHPALYDETCRMITTEAGVPVRLSSTAPITADGVTAPTWFAAVAYPDATVMITMSQWGIDEGLPLKQPIYTDQALADLATVPGFKP